MSIKSKKERGDILKIPLEEGRISYALVLGGTVTAFFDVKEVEKATPIFSVCVMNYALNEWEKVGFLKNIPQIIEENPPFFKKDPISGNLYKTYDG